MKPDLRHQLIHLETRLETIRFWDAVEDCAAELTGKQIDAMLDWCESMIYGR